MAIKPWSEFYPDVLLSVQGCPAPVVDHYLRAAAVELCSKSRGMKYGMPAFATVAGTSDYALAPGAGFETVGILDGMADGRPIEPLRRDELAAIVNWQSEQGTPTRFLMVENTETVRLWKTPDSVISIALTLAVKPSRTATGIERVFGERYLEGLVSGALASLLILPKTPWTDAGLAAIHAEKAQLVIRKASAESAKDATRAPLRTATYGRA